MTPRLAIHNCLDNSPQYSLLLAHHGETEGALAEEFEALVGIERVVQARANISIKALQWQALEVRCAANRPQREIDRLDPILDRNHAGGQFPGMIRLVAGPKESMWPTHVASSPQSLFARARALIPRRRGAWPAPIDPRA
jgi:hypothetical protein